MITKMDRGAVVCSCVTVFLCYNLSKWCWFWRARWFRSKVLPITNKSQVYNAAPFLPQLWYLHCKLRWQDTCNELDKFNENEMSSKTQIPKKEMSELGGAVFSFGRMGSFLKRMRTCNFSEDFVLSPTIMEVKNGHFKDTWGRPSRLNDSQLPSLSVAIGGQLTNCPTKMLRKIHFV